MDAKIRVMLIDLPPLIREILEHEISHQPDFEVVARGRASEQPRAGVPPAPDAIILGADVDKAVRDAASLLDIWPRTEVLVVAGTGRDAALYDLRRHKVALGQVSAAEATEAVRDAVRRRRQRREA